MRIRIYDTLHPEDNAMLQALYARSAESVETHMTKVEAAGSGKFMSTYYVGYGHKSIADCGSTTIFIEGVSMLAAKAIQDWPLYSGQETSTRAIDMSKQLMVSPEGLQAEVDILKPLMDFYLKHQAAVEQHVVTKHARLPGEDEKTYRRAVKSRVFDIMRGFLPAGCTTQLSWHTNLRQAGDHLDLLVHHPLEEVRDIAKGIMANLLVKYPDTFANKKVYDEQERYRRMHVKRFTYFDPNICSEEVSLEHFIGESVGEYLYLLEERPKKTNLPEFLTGLAKLTYRFQLDFGSFRDLQRHRHGVCRMPVLSTRYGFHPWYLNQLPSEVRVEAEGLLKTVDEEVACLHVSDVKAQYYVPMGFKVPCEVTYGIPAAVYLIELRTQKGVHPTMRAAAQGMADETREVFQGAKINIALHDDRDDDDWSIRRGLASIEPNEDRRAREQAPA